MSANPNAPIIIKRKKSGGGDGHHGGAWKVAYADFVTAMMAFFLLMWLLNSTSEAQRSGIADYFTPTIPIVRSSSGGEDIFSGESVFTQDTKAEQAKGGVAEMEGMSFDSESAAAENAMLEDLESKLLGIGGESFLSENELRHIVTRLTDEGLVIEVFDVPGAPLFVDVTDQPNPVTVEIFDTLTQVLSFVKNGVAISGHVQSVSILRRDYSAWDLTTSRASAVRKMLEGAGLQPSRVERLTGKADREPATTDPQADRNNRIELIVLRSDL